MRLFLVKIGLFDVGGSISLYNEIDSINEKYRAAYDLEQILVSIDEIGHNRDAQSRQQAVEQIR